MPKAHSSSKSRIVLQARVGVGMRTRSLPRENRAGVEEQSYFLEARTEQPIAEESDVTIDLDTDGPKSPESDVPPVLEPQEREFIENDPGEGTSRHCFTPSSSITPSYWALCSI